MTNHWTDIQHADAILIMGANPAENHPISFRWILKAKEKGGKVISVDPRFTRTSTQADVYAPLRSGTDIAFIGGMINYALTNNLYHKEYVAAYTNASFIVKDEYSFEDGMFNNYDAKTRSYDKSTWAFVKDENDQIKRDMSLSDPRCVFQLMKKHYSRYDVDTVCKTTGTPKEQYLKVVKEFTATGKPGKAGTILYAMGTTQHTVGSQNVRIFGIIQLLLGNIGIQGGGVNALRGESNVQGSTDFGLLYHNTTGYMETPVSTDTTYKAFLERITPKSGFQANKPKFYTSLLKAYYGDSATKQNEFGYHYLPKLTPKKDYSHMKMFEGMHNGEIEGMFMFGTNPVIGGPNSRNGREGLGKLKWLVAVDLWETESSAFWQEVAGSKPSEIDTEVFFLPACGSYEKEGTVSNSGRWMQYRYQAIKPKGESLSDLEIVHQLALRLKKLYKNSAKPQDKPIQALTWDYGNGHHPDIDLISQEINGKDLKTGKLLPGFSMLTDDGSTSSGNWIYCGFYPEEGKNLSKRRDNTDEGMGNFLNWSYAWPMNRRILYNRASADLNGKPWSQDRVGIYWDAKQKLWVGNDVPDFAKDKAPDAEGGSDPFIMMADGVGGLFAPMNDGPFPEHYEPFETPTKHALSSVQLNPAVKLSDKQFNPKGDRDKYPIVATTYRVSEHWQSGSMTRNQEWLSELVSHMFIELSEELAKEKGIKSKDEVIVTSARGEIKAYAMVTKRFKPYKVNGKTVHQIGMPWSFGYKGIVTGAIANQLTPHIGDANSSIPESKAFLCDIRRA